MCSGCKTQGHFNCGIFTNKFVIFALASDGFFAFGMPTFRLRWLLEDLATVNICTSSSADCYAHVKEWACTRKAAEPSRTRIFQFKPKAGEGGAGRKGSRQVSTVNPWTGSEISEIKTTPTLQSVNMAFTVWKKPTTKVNCVFKQVSEIGSYLKFIGILWYKDYGISAEIPLFEHKG